MDNQKPVVILIIGGPGSGKRTYCKKLSEDFRVNSPFNRRNIKRREKEKH